MLRRLYLSLVISMSVAFLAGCPPVGDGDGDDPDGDLLSNSFESSIGTDPDNADTDGDGWSDTEEYFTYFNPRNDGDYPYTGHYPRGPLAWGDDWDAITGDDTGWGQDDFSSNWSHEDRWEDKLRLKRFYGSVILLDLSAEWCNPCRVAAETLEEEYTSRREDGFVVIQLMMDGLNPANPPDLERWADEFDLTIPLISDHDQEVVRRYVPGGGGWGIPNYTIIDRNHQIVDWYQAGGTANFTLVDQLLEEEKPDIEYEWPDNAAEIRAELGLEEGSWVHPFETDAD